MALSIENETLTKINRKDLPAGVELYRMGRAYAVLAGDLAFFVMQDRPGSWGVEALDDRTAAEFRAKIVPDRMRRSAEVSDSVLGYAGTKTLRAMLEKIAAAVATESTPEPTPEPTPAPTSTPVLDPAAAAVFGFWSGVFSVLSSAPVAAPVRKPTREEKRLDGIKAEARKWGYYA